MSSVFLSHSSADRDFVRRLGADLRESGVHVWIDEAEIQVGDSLIRKIGDGINEVDYLAVVLSPSSVSSKWVNRELEIALNQEIATDNVKVLPILYRKCRIPTFLEGKVWADFTEPSSYRLAVEVLLRRLLPDRVPSMDAAPSLEHLRDRCRTAFNCHLATLGPLQSTGPGIELLGAEQPMEARCTWQGTLDIDTMLRRSRDSFVEGGPTAAKPAGGIAEWLGCIQQIELDLAREAKDLGRFRQYNKIAESLINDLWRTTDTLVSEYTSELLPVALYWTTRFRIGEERRRLIYPASQSAFAPLLGLADLGVFFSGMKDSNTFQWVMGKTNDHGDHVDPQVPILAGTDCGLNSFTETPSQSSARVYSDARIESRIGNLNRQILAGQTALLRHLGYWAEVLFIRELLYTSFDSIGFTSLLTVTASAIRQKHLLTLRQLDNSVHLPGIDIADARWDSTMSIWQQAGPITSTQVPTGPDETRCSDPILDVQIVNYDDEARIIQEAMLRQYGSWSEVKAMPMYGVLDSAHTYNLRADFAKPMTTLRLDPPVYVAARGAARIHLRLLILYTCARATPLSYRLV